ncbi:elongation factor EF-2 [Candidatus Micrarchaeota archaeon]|nr:elongation factor EF-2 [Candidatus Micrarchaeota archaeon]
MNNRENIRNIGVVAHIDHGKCIAPNERLILYNGEAIKAEELFSEAEKIGIKVAEDEEKTVFQLPESFFVFSLNKQTGAIEKKPVTHAWKLKNSAEMKKITLRNGFSVTTTQEHRFLILNNLKYEEKEAKELKKGDRIVCVRKTETNSEINLKEELLKSISEKPFYVTVKKDAYESLKEETRKFYLNKKYFLSGFYGKKRLPLKDFLEMRKKTGKNYGQAYDEIETINFKCGEKIILPKNFEDFFYLAGLFFGDGTGKKFIVGKEKLAKKFSGICKELGFTPKRIEKKDRVPELYSNNTLSEILNSLFDYPKKMKSHNIRASGFLFKADKRFSSKFLQAYFDCDGTVEKSRSAISLTSVSKQMIKDLQLLLLKFSCITIVNKEDNTIYISGESSKKFVEEIGFFLEEKMQKAVALAENTTGNIVCDLIPVNEGLVEFRNTQNTKTSMNALGKHYYKYENQTYAPTAQTFKKIINAFSSAGIDTIALEKINTEELSFIEVEEISGEYHKEVFDFTVKDNHNFVAQGMIIHNTTMTDNLIAASGIISTELAGKQQFMDYYELEQERGITINAANVSIVQKYEGKDFLINIIDTPGHIDFGGEVIRAMRAVDGVILVVDSVEGVMPQTETVIRQALKENVKPCLFINKVDRLVNELQLTPEQMQERFVKTITQVNNLISRNAPKEFKEKWTVKVENGSVVFGSAYYNWAISALHMKRTGISFKGVYDYCKNQDQKTLAQKSSLYEAIVELVIQHLPNPLQAQKYRIPKIWKGETESEEGKAMLACDKEGPLAMMVVDVSVDPHAGDVATGRIYSGTVRKGTNVKLIGSQKEIAVQQVGLFMGPERVAVSEIPAGNIAALVGLKEVYAGETISTLKMKEFESFMSNAEPVITVSVEAKEAKNLPKLIEVIRQITKEDPNIRAAINQDTGEHLLSGMGELHLEVTQHRIEVDHKVPITVSPPIVVYRETITKKSPPKHEAKTPNKHNKFYMHVEKIPDEILEKLIESKIQGKIRDKDKHLVEQFIDMGIDREEAKRIWAVNNNCYIVNATKGIEALFEVKELIVQAFNDATNEGPLAKEKCQGVKVLLVDAKLHEDAIHRGPAQVLPAITRGIYACMLQADAVLLEPKQILSILVPLDFMGSVSKELGARRTQITDMRNEGDQTIIIGKSPVKELIGFSASIRGATQGRAVWTAEYAGYEMLPRELQHKTIVEIRTRKGMDPEPKKADFFFD